MTEETLQVNKMTDNQLAKKYLLKVGWTPDPEQPYLRQLLLWGLEEGGLRTEPEVEAMVGQMLALDPALWMTELSGANLEQPTPKDLAWAVLDHLESSRRLQTM